MTFFLSLLNARKRVQELGHGFLQRATCNSVSHNKLGLFMCDAIVV